tara:strand:- start:1953 stop:2237 length:285 start_codon:yes stop_codon:yes gene_type:complete
MELNNNSNKGEELNVLKASIIAKATRGKFISVRRVLRDIAAVDDAIIDAQSSSDTSMEKLMGLLSSNPAKIQKDARIDALEAKIDKLTELILNP